LHYNCQNELCLQHCAVAVGISPQLAEHLFLPHLQSPDGVTVFICNMAMSQNTVKGAEDGSYFILVGPFCCQCVSSRISAFNNSVVWGNGKQMRRRNIGINQLKIPQKCHRLRTTVFAKPILGTSEWRKEKWDPAKFETHIDNTMQDSRQQRTCQKTTNAQDSLRKLVSSAICTLD